MKTFIYSIILLIVIIVFAVVSFHSSESAIEFSSANQIQDSSIISVLIYDTNLDADKGAWRDDKTKSWYNEDGAFPSAAYLLLSNSGLDILDANTNTLYVQFLKGLTHLLPNTDYTSVSALNGKILIGTTNGLIVLDFITDSARWFTSEEDFFINNAISGRNNPAVWSKRKNSTIGNNNVHDTAITRVQETDCAAIATDRGVSLINLDTNKIYRSSGSLGVINAVAFGNNDLYYCGDNGLLVKYDIDLLDDNWTKQDFTYSINSTPKIIGNTINEIAVMPGSSTSSSGSNTIYGATTCGSFEIQENRTLPVLALVTNWTDEILSSNNITRISTDGAIVCFGSALGVDEVKLIDKAKLYKNYAHTSSPSIVSNNVTSLSVKGLVLVGTPSGCTVLDETWWDVPCYKYRQQLIIKNNALSELEEGYSVKFTFNHADLVSSGKSLANGNDIRIAFYDGTAWTELDRTFDINSAWNTGTTSIWFKTKSKIPNGYKDSRYYIYYGNPKATAPPCDKNNIFLLWEDFEDDPINLPPAGWVNDREDEFIISKSISNRLMKYRYINNENDITLTASKDIGNFELGFVVRKLTKNSDPLNKIGVLFHSGENGYRLSLGTDGTTVLQDENFKDIPAVISKISFLDDKDYRLKVQVYDTTLKAYWENSEILNAAISNGAGEIGFFNDNGYAIGGPEIDEIYLRKYIEPEPTVDSNNIEMANVPIGDIKSADQVKSSTVDITFTVDSPYDQNLKAKLEWSINPTTGFQKCNILTGGENLTSDYPENISRPIIDNLNSYQILNIPTSKGPNTINLQWAPALSSGFPLDTVNTYWLKLTANNDSCDQEVPDIISLTVDTRGVSAELPGEEAQTQETQISEQIFGQTISETAEVINEGTQIIQENYIPGKTAKLEFTTAPQTIAVNNVSGIMTIQLQDIDGNPITAEQDIVIELGSTSTVVEYE